MDATWKTFFGYPLGPNDCLKAKEQIKIVSYTKTWPFEKH